LAKAIATVVLSENTEKSRGLPPYLDAWPTELSSIFLLATWSVESLGVTFS
jgi:hypothetical protein